MSKIEKSNKVLKKTKKNDDVMRMLTIVKNVKKICYDNFLKFLY